MTKPADALSAVTAGILNGTIRVVDLTVPLEPATPVDVYKRQHCGC